MFDKLPPFLKNKYSIAFLVFLVWMMFFDRNRIINQVRLVNTMNDLKTEGAYYRNEILHDSTELHILEHDKNELERFAREKYLMKRDNEDLYLVVEEKED
jgi:cell division protein FtsB